MDRAVVKIDRVPICECGYVQSIRLTGLLLRGGGKKWLPRFMVVVLSSVNKKGRVLYALYASTVEPATTTRSLRLTHKRITLRSFLLRVSFCARDPSSFALVFIIFHASQLCRQRYRDAITISRNWNKNRFPCSKEMFASFVMKYFFSNFFWEYFYRIMFLLNFFPLHWDILKIYGFYFLSKLLIIN